MALFDGFPVYESQLAIVSSQIKRHKRKRINKKWLKKYGTKSVPGMYFLNNCFYAHPDIMKKLKKEAHT